MSAVYLEPAIVKRTGFSKGERLPSGKRQLAEERLNAIRRGQEDAAMNLLLGIVVGILLTIGTAFIADAYSETSNRGSDKPARLSENAAQRSRRLLAIMPPWATALNASKSSSKATIAVST